MVAGGLVFVVLVLVALVQTPHFISTRAIFKVSDHAKEPSLLEGVLAIWNCDVLANLKYCIVLILHTDKTSTQFDVGLLANLKYCIVLILHTDKASTQFDVGLVLMASSFGVGIHLESVSWT
jgi:hypothetical protein